MIDIKKTLGFLKLPLIGLITLTCVGILLNSIRNVMIITAWWIFVFVVLAICILWVGYRSGKNKFSLTEAGMNGVITWLVPGAIGLTISGINIFITALLWGNIEGYEILAFLGGTIVIVILLAIGSVIAFVLAGLGRSIGQRF